MNTPDFNHVKPSISIGTECIARWFTTARDSDNRDRALECFWDTQLSAKAWLITELKEHFPESHNILYVFGGWYGVLASMIMETYSLQRIDHLYSIDIDPDCAAMVHKINYPYLVVHGVTADMSEFTYPWEHPPTVVINTSSEHVEQGVYDTWYDKIPRGTLIVVQGNNFFECNEHVRCSRSLREFIIMNHAVDPLYIGELANNQYTRYMAIWRK